MTLPIVERRVGVSITEANIGKKPDSLQVISEEIKEQHFCSLMLLIYWYCLIKKIKSSSTFKPDYHEILLVVLSELFSYSLLAFILLLPS